MNEYDFPIVCGLWDNWRACFYVWIHAWKEDNIGQSGNAESWKDIIIMEGEARELQDKNTKCKCNDLPGDTLWLWNIEKDKGRPTGKESWCLRDVDLEKDDYGLLDREKNKWVDTDKDRTCKRRSFAETEGSKTENVVCWQANGLEMEMMLACGEGRRKRGRPREKWMEKIH